MNFSNVIKSINQLQPHMWVLLTTFALSTVVSGCLVEMVLDSERFWSAGTSKIVLIAFCLTLPVWAINSLMMWTALRKGSGKRKIQTAMIGGGLFTFIIYMMTVLMAVMGLAKNRNLFILYICLFEALFVSQIIWTNFGKEAIRTKIRHSLLHIVLAVLNVISGFVILQIVFGFFPLIPCSLSEERVDLINGFVVDISVGIITSTFFYYLLVYIAEKRRNKQVRLLNQDKLNFLCGLMQVLVGYFCDKYQISCNRGDLLDADFSNIPPTQNFGEEPMIFWLKREMVSDYSGSTEIGFLNFYLMKIRDHASMLYASNAMILDDLELLSLITRIKDSKLISSAELLNDNRKQGILIPALSRQIIDFFDLYKSLAVYAEIKDISLKGEKPDNIIPIVYK